jgi:hypothetical protein
MSPLKTTMDLTIDLAHDDASQVGSNLPRPADVQDRRSGAMHHIDLCKPRKWLAALAIFVS